VSNGSFYYKDVNTNIDLYAYYPYAAVNNTSEYEFEVAADQSGVNSTDGYALSDFLWAKATNVTPSQNKVSLHFYHRMSATCVALKEGQGFESGEFEKLSKTVLAMNTTRTSTINLSTGVVTPTGAAESEGIVMKSNAEGFRAIVVPQSVEAGVALFTITIDGIAYQVDKANLVPTAPKSAPAKKSTPKRAKGSGFDFNAIKGKTNADKNKALHAALVKAGMKDSRTAEYLAIWNARPWAK
jgi:hypothetical protein